MAEPGQHLPTRRRRVYPSDTTDVEWQILARLVPVGGTRPGVGGRPVTYPRRDIVDAIRYVARTGCQWDALPVDLPPTALVKHYFAVWARDGTLARIHNTLREQVRQAEGRTPSPSAALVDSQSLRGAETVGHTSRGYDGGKKVNGRKRHMVTDTCGWLLAVLVTGAHVQDRDAGHLLMWITRTVFPTIRLVWADGGYAGKLVDYAHATLGLTVQIVAKLTGQVGFVVLHRRWCVERTFSWINRPAPSETTPSAKRSGKYGTTPPCKRYGQAHPCAVPSLSTKPTERNAATTPPPRRARSAADPRT